LFRFEPKPIETPSCFGHVSVCFVKLRNFFSDPELKKVEPKQTETGQNKDQQAKNRQIRAKQSESNQVKRKK
jgi:hypothetical protein